MSFLLVLTILLAMAVLAMAGPLLEDLLDRGRSAFQRHGKLVRPPRGDRAPGHSLRR
jgi:hypothetical protein